MFNFVSFCVLLHFLQKVDKILKILSSSGLKRLWRTKVLLPTKADAEKGTAEVVLLYELFFVLFRVFVVVC